MAHKLASLQYPTSLNARLLRLAIRRTTRLGLSRTLSRPQYLEMLISEEEKREHENETEKAA